MAKKEKREVTERLEDPLQASTEQNFDNDDDSETEVLNLEEIFYAGEF